MNLYQLKFVLTIKKMNGPVQAIKEAQKTLDKALDIQEGEEPGQDKQGEF